MSQIHGKDTKPEMAIRRLLWREGYHYRLHRKDLPGKPDLVLSKYKAVIFVHGCFWHRHGCKYTTHPMTRKEFWEMKFQSNVERDKRNISNLIETSWRVLIIWECAIKNNADEANTLLEQIIQFLHSEQRFHQIPSNYELY